MDRIRRTGAQLAGTPGQTGGKPSKSKVGRPPVWMGGMGKPSEPAARSPGVGKLLVGTTRSIFTAARPTTLRRKLPSPAKTSCSQKVAEMTALPLKPGWIQPQVD